jgi:hypothetical protein
VGHRDQFYDIGDERFGRDESEGTRVLCCVHARSLALCFVELGFAQQRLKVPNARYGLLDFYPVVNSQLFLVSDTAKLQPLNCNELSIQVNKSQINQ